MQIKKLVLTGAAAALVGGFAFAPIAHAEDSLPENDLVQVDGEQSSDTGGHLVIEGQGGIPVNPLDDGHIGVHGDGEAGEGGLYGSCDGTDEDGNYKPFDPTDTESESDMTKCTPGPA